MRSWMQSFIMTPARRIEEWVSGAIKQNSYVVYSPPIGGLPFLAVILASDGTATARPFDSAEEAAAFNRHMAAAGHPGKVRN